MVGVVGVFVSGIQLQEPINRSGGGVVLGLLIVGIGDIELRVGGVVAKREGCLEAFEFLNGTFELVSVK